MKTVAGKCFQLCTGLAAKEAALTEEQKAALAKKAEKKAAEDAALAAEYEKMRAAAKASPLHI